MIAKKYVFLVRVRVGSSLFLISFPFFAVVGCNEIYVSRYRGNNLPSCGKTFKTACKTIALATTQAQWNDTIYIDGIETSRDPYPCSSLTSHPEGINVNKSLFFKRYGIDEAVLRCLSTRPMIFDGRNVTERAVVIRLEGLTFFNSHVIVRKCSLYVENCLFKDAISFPSATAVVHFESLEDQLSLTIRTSTFSNNGYPCIYFLGSTPKIEVYNTTFINNTAIGRSTSYKWVDLGVFMVLLPTKQVQYPGAFVTFTNTSFMKNTAPLGGCIQLEGIVSSGSENRNIVKGRREHKDRRSTKDVNIFSQTLYCAMHKGRQSSAKEYLSIRVSEGTFTNNLGRAMTITIVSGGNISIVRSHFVNNSSPIGGAIFLYEITKLLLHIENSTFVGNSAPSTGSAIYADELASLVCAVLVRNVLFLRNVIAGNDSSDANGGTLTIEQPYNLTVLLEDVSFMYNTATVGSSSLYVNAECFQNIRIVDSSFIGNSQNERFSYGWAVARIVSVYLNCSINRTIISGNFAKARVNNLKVEGRPIHFFVISNGLGQIDINGIQYKNNTGSGIYIQVDNVDASVNSTIISVQNSQFEDNELFSLNVKAGINILMQMKRIVFRGNKFVSSYFSSAPLFFLSSLTQGNQVTVTMEDILFEKNTAPGRILFFQLPPDQQNLHSCSNLKWYYSNHLRLTNVTFRENNAVNSSVLRFESGWNVLSNCQFVDNLAVYTVFVAESSTKLELIDTSFEKGPQWTFMSPFKFRGFIYYASHGPIKMKNTTLNAEPFQDVDAYFMVTGSSLAHIDNSSIIQCPIGTLQSLQNFTHPRLVSNVYCDPTVYETVAQSFIFSCKRCSPGFYSIEPFGKTCRPCPYGGNCTNNIAAKPTFWGFPSLSYHGSVSFRQCPMDYCCPYQNISCEYNNQRYLASGCSGNRTGFLCGTCKPGFTETLFSAQCRESNECKDYWFWPVALFYSFTFGFFLLWKSPIISFVKRLLPWARHLQTRHSAGDSASNGGGYIKVIFYFCQVASLVFVSRDTEMHLVESYLLFPVIGWFDFKAISSNEGLICPWSKLTVALKMFLQASQVFAVFSGLLIIFFLHGAVRKFQRKSPVFPPLDQYLAATTECFLLGYSTLAQTAFKALNCVPIQSSSRFFYDGNIQCWQWWQKLCGVYIAVFIVPFVFVLYRGSKLLHANVITTKRFFYACMFPLPFAIGWMVSWRKIPLNEAETYHGSRDEEQLPLLPPDRSTRESPTYHGSRDEEQLPLLPPDRSTQKSPSDPTAEVIYGPFKKRNDGQGSGAVYWESVLIGRRLMLICLHTFIVFPFIRIVCLSVACAFILAHHLWKKPFKDPRVNLGETASLTALLVLAVINMAEVTFAINGGISEQERICLIVLNVVEVIILGTVPVACFLLIMISVLWQLLKFCKLCWISFCRIFVKTS